MVTRSGRLYACDECALKYADEAVAKKCEAWCSAHQSCNLEIMKNAVK